MIRILCFGDSNTWGTIADGSFKHCNIEHSYPSVLQKMLGSNYMVIAEGMPSRTTDLDDIKFPKGNRNGSLFFGQCVITHDPLDFVVIMLGSNDMKSKFNRTAEETATVVEEKYIKFLQNHLSLELTKNPKIIIVAPPLIDESKIDEMFEGATKKSEKFNDLFKQIATKNNCLFINNDGLECGNDGLHLTPKGLATLAQKVYDVVVNG